MVVEVEAERGGLHSEALEEAAAAAAHRCLA